MSHLKIEVSKAADTLMSQSAMFSCSLEEAWEKWMHPLITERISFNEVKNYIDKQVALGKRCGRE